MSDQICLSSRSLLTVIDVQERLGEAMPGKVLNRVIQNSQLLIRSAAELAIPIAITEQYPQGLGPTIATVSGCVPEGVHQIEKTSFSCAAVDAYEKFIEASQRSQIVLLGMEAHVCVLQTALDLKNRGLTVYVVEDAICSRRLENYQNALDRLGRAGINVVSAESVVFEWLADAAHPSFKTIQSLLR